MLLDAMKHARTGDRRLHLFGLVSDGGVHSQQAHLYALLKMAKQNGLDTGLRPRLHGWPRHAAYKWRWIS